MMQAGASEQPKSVGIWIRVSTEDQVRGESPEHHEARARAYASLKGWLVAEVYRLDAVRGKAVLAHPTAMRMLADIRSGVITGLVFSKLARLARNTRELLELAEVFRACNADMISLAESIDTSTPAGRLFFTMIAAMAQWEREEIADRVAASVPIRAKLGKSLGGRAPFGYQWCDKKLLPHTEEAAVRRLIYELYREHGRKKTVANTLNARGYRTRAGKEFSAMSIEELIRDPTPKGLHRANHSTQRNGRYEAKPEHEWIYVPVEPIVSEDLWEACNRTLMSRKSGAPFPGPRPEHLFGGRVRCTCGTKMYARKQTGKYACEACGTKIPAGDLEAIYHSQLSSFLFSDAEIAAFLERSDGEANDLEALIDRQSKERDDLQRQIDHLFELHLAGEFPTEGFGRKYQPLEERLNQIDGDLIALQAKLDAGKIARLNQDYMLNEARTLHARWPSLSLGQKKEIVQAITDEIIVGVDEIDIRLQYLPEFGSPVEKGKDQVGSPEGWLCTRMTAEAESSIARRTTSRG
jgi:site-specific DNA recombinase